MAAVQLKSVASIHRDRLHFWVPAYQRGYRWRREQVNQLLRDFHKFAETEEENAPPFYCLQPLIVQKKDNGYEVVDGQQRLTTLYLLFKAMEKITAEKRWSPGFTLEYEARKHSREFLQNISNFPEKRNPDFFFMGEAYRTICDYLDQNPSFQKHLEKLLLCDDPDARNVRFIWYEYEGAMGLSGEDIFLRINTGRIPLTNAEIIRGYLLMSKHYREKAGRREEHARLLDTIRETLEDNTLWFFLSPEDYEDRMDLMFELMTLSPDTPRKDEGYALANRVMEQETEDKKRNVIDDIWKQLRANFSYLRFVLFEDVELYNLVGFKIAITSDPTKRLAFLREVLEVARTRPRSDLRAFCYLAVIHRDIPCLEQEGENENVKNLWIYIENNDVYVRTGASPRDVCRMVDLSYSQRERVKHALLLYNLLAYFPVCTTDKGSSRAFRIKGKFPFHRYHVEQWSVEHIHAQKSVGFSSPSEALEWFNHVNKKGLLQTSVAKNLENDNFNQLKQEIDQMIETLKNNPGGEWNEGLKSRAVELMGTVFDYFGAGDNGNYHENDISNLALMPKNENTRLSNHPFPLKRALVLEMDANGSFFPPRTRDVFLKAFQEIPENLTIWGVEDRERYEKHIRNALRWFLVRVRQIAQGGSP